MKYRFWTLLGFGIYLTISFVLLLSLLVLRAWVAVELKTLLSYLLIGTTLIFLATMFSLYFKTKRKQFLYFAITGLIPSVVAVPFFEKSIFEARNRLSGKQEVLELTYIAWGCDHANWVRVDDFQKYAGKHDDSLAQRSIFIEPADDKIKIPDTLISIHSTVRFKGQFYVNKGYPKRYISFENPPKARIFRYTEYSIIGK